MTVAALAALAGAGRQADAADPPINVPAGERGELPRSEGGEPLNLDFERGTLDDWTAEGEAFRDQPVRGEIALQKGRPFGEDKKSEHTGDFWIGGYEIHRDTPTGTLTSKAFTVEHPFASFLVGGGSHKETRVELVRERDGKVIFTARGRNQENLRPVVVDLKPHQGEKIFIRLVDEHTGGWGHVNFDDFRMHAGRPRFNLPAEDQPPPGLADLYPHAGLDAEAAARAMELPQGFSVQVGAAEPDVMQPIAMAIDDRGRLWIAEAYEYPRRAPEGEGRDRILIFEDTTGDGRLDQRKVFIEGLNLVSGLEVGFGGVWVGAAPHLLFIPDRDRDDQPDGEPQILLDGWGFQDTHETLNAFIWGPDGWLYGCHGVFTHSRVGKPGAADEERVPLNAGIWRYHPVRHEFEVFAHGTSNPWGVDFNDYGHAFCTACVIPHLFHVIQGARYHRQAGQHFNPHTYDDIKTIARHRHYVGNQWNQDDRQRSDQLGGGHAHAGAMIYLGGAWPKEYRNQIFMSNIHGNRVNLDRLTPGGSGYVGDGAPDFLLTRDQWSQILNLRYGPDGQVWMIDWYDRQQCHRNELEAHDRSNGRIYRIAHQAKAAPVKVDMQSLTDAELIDRLLHDNDWHVRHARRVLQERAAAGSLSSEAKAGLEKLAAEHPDATRRLRGLWALHSTFGVSESLAQKLLASDSPHVRSWTIQLLCERADRPPSSETLQRFAEMARRDNAPLVRLYLASALQRLPLEARWDILAGLGQHASDAADHNLPLMFWYAAEPLAEADPRRALAWAMTAGERIPLLADYMVRRIAALKVGQPLDLLVDGLRDAASPGEELTFLRGISGALRGQRQASPPSAWSEVFARLAKSEDSQVRFETFRLAATFGDASAKEALRNIAADHENPREVRAAALASAVKTQDRQIIPQLHEMLHEPAMRGEALRALAAFDDQRTAEEVLGAYKEFSPEERRDALATLCSRPASAQKLLAAIEQKQIPASHLTGDLVRQIESLGDPQLSQQIAKAWGVVRPPAADRAAAIEQYKKLIAQSPSEPDLSLGRAVFAKTCQQCHSLFETGGRVGPDLTGANRADLNYLLSNILDPSAVMAKEYQPSVVVTADGRVLVGIVREGEGDFITVQTATEQVVVPRDEIEELKQSDKSMMPDNLLAPLSDREVHALTAYLASSLQVPLLATEENAAGLFNGVDLAGWRGDEGLWSVEEGQIVGRSPGIRKNAFLISEMEVEDFRLTLDVKLTPNEGNSGIQFRSEALAAGEVKGYQADIGAGWWGKLYEEHGRALLWNKSGERHVKPGDWNTYEIEARGSRIKTWINGQLCVDLDDPDGAQRGILALQIHSGGPMEVRFRNFKLEVK